MPIISQKEDDRYIRLINFVALLCECPSCGEHEKCLDDCRREDNAIEVDIEMARQAYYGEK